MKNLPCFDDSIEVDVLLEDTLRIGVHDPLKFHPFNAFKSDFCRFHMLGHIRSVQERWKIWLKHFHVKYRVQVKEMRNT
jgi:hypothetical protein